jgi:hypothetical protein
MLGRIKRLEQKIKPERRMIVATETDDRPGVFITQDGKEYTERQLREFSEAGDYVILIVREEVGNADLERFA